MELEFAQPHTIFRPALSASLLKLTKRAKDDELTLEERWALDYIAGNVMERFVPTYCFLGSAEVSERIDTVTDAIMKAIRTGGDPFGNMTADRALFMTGMFWEFLERRKFGSFYEEVGIASYSHLRAAHELPEFKVLYGMLAENFAAYGTVIRMARDDSRYFERTADWSRIVPYHTHLPRQRLSKETVY